MKTLAPPRRGLTAAFAILLMATTSGLAAAQSPTTEQLLRLLQQQQRQIDDLKAMLEKAHKQSEKAVATAEAAKEAPKDESFLSKVQIGGVLEVEATNAGTFAGGDTSDLALAKMELFAHARPSDWLGTHVQLIFEDGDDNIKLDEAFATLGNLEEFPLFAQAGQWAVPFGYFDTAMSTDPLTKSLGETKEAAVLIGGQWRGFTVQGYAYNGDAARAAKGNYIDQGGLFTGYQQEMGDLTIDTGLGFITNMADSDALTEGLGGNAGALGDYVPGASLHLAVTWKGATLRSGYMTALDRFGAGELTFNGQGAKPKAWHVEASYVMPILGKDTTFAATAQGTEDALALALPKTRYGGAVGVEIIRHAHVIAEYLHDEDYDMSKGGTGENGHIATLKLAVDF